ncbi:hypothetical protein PMI41_00006 [Phyllobacterium sp. YR531]|nr:hypothetical protein PMI41_00006 [Phyllobacterium sp. YR531]
MPQVKVNEMALCAQAMAASERAIEVATETGALSL